MDVFQRLDQAEVVVEPFPYLVVENVLDRELCETLIDEIPPLNVLTCGAASDSNKRFTLSQQEALTDPRISKTWRDVLTQGLSQSFADRVLKLFAPHIRRELVDFEQRFGDLNQLRAVTRQSDHRVRGTIGLDAQIAVNTPALVPGTTVRGPHLDRTDKLFIGLLYLRPEHDDSQGGDLELYVPKSDAPVFEAKRLLPRDQVQLVRTIPYRRNSLVLFLNTPRSLHGVSPRGVTPHPRYFLNLVGEMHEPLFDIVCPTSNDSSNGTTERSRRGIRNWFRRAG